MHRFHFRLTLRRPLNFTDRKGSIAAGEIFNPPAAMLKSQRLFAVAYRRREVPQAAKQPSATKINVVGSGTADTETPEPEPGFGIVTN